MNEPSLVRALGQIELRYLEAEANSLRSLGLRDVIRMGRDAIVHIVMHKHCT
ncbi:hypothetical protein PILCRDRAFT_812435 [Piloderma croceum F 1598]|uniref:Uncharacterized protein n=1 Tax=Piloderma croceum (strain F 1598) TaxID=765440 RepID=A0A0C3CIU5_PILCF|nr:hypothetical protein PILCRDRAFT_812435 [Piloderma croceum F 1598]